MNQDQEFSKAYCEAKEALCEVIEELQDKYQFSAVDAARLVAAKVKQIPLEESFWKMAFWLAESSASTRKSNSVKKQLEYDDEAPIAF